MVNQGLYQNLMVKNFKLTFSVGLFHDAKYTFFSLFSCSGYFFVCEKIPMIYTFWAKFGEYCFPKRATYHPCPYVCMYVLVSVFSICMMCSQMLFCQQHVSSVLTKCMSFEKLCSHKGYAFYVGSYFI